MRLMCSGSDSGNAAVNSRKMKGEGYQHSLIQVLVLEEFGSAGSSLF